MWLALAVAAAGAGCGDGDEEAARLSPTTRESNAAASAQDAGEARILRFERDGDVGGLAAEIADPDLRMARMALAALRRIGGDEAIGQIAAAMGDNRPEVRSAAAHNYGNCPPRSSAPVLAGLVRADPSPAVRATAGFAIGKLCAYRETDTLLAVMADDAELSVRRNAANAVWAIFGKRLAYDAEAPLRSRREAVDHIGKVWDTDRKQIGAFHDMKRGDRR